MTRILLSGVLCCSCALKVYCQDISTWAEELAALRALQHSVQQEYRTMTTGLTNIGEIKADEYSRHQAYYQSLFTVKKIFSYDQVTSYGDTGSGGNDHQEPIDLPANGTTGIRRPKTSLH